MDFGKYFIIKNQINSQFFCWKTRREYFLSGDQFMLFYHNVLSLKHWKKVECFSSALVAEAWIKRVKEN